MELSKKKKKKHTQEKNTQKNKEDINMGFLSKNYLQGAKNLNRSVHGARGKNWNLEWHQHFRSQDTREKQIT